MSPLLPSFDWRKSINLKYVFIRNRALALTVEYGVCLSPRLPTLPVYFPQNGGVHAGVDIPADVEHRDAFCPVGLGLPFHCWRVENT
ncbi:hypothetical protein KCP75_03995 [Salmonella enterica subsp. enterica]|nr:hypothetical protein KCP75_03995 [Salmonella enterica subsp. enterica]